MPQRGILSGVNYIVMLLVTAFLFVCSAEGWTQDSPTLEERLIRMEQEIQSLKDGNASLEREVRRLKEQLAVREGAGIDTLEEVASETTAPELPADLSQETKESENQFIVAYKKGLSIASDDNRFKLKVGGRVTTRFTTLDSGHPANNEFSVERARLYVKATLLDHYSLRIQSELSEDPKLKDGYINIDHMPWAELRLGQFKPPYTWENLQSHKYLDFADRSIAVNNIRKPSRDIGLMFHGRLLNDRLGYQLAVLNGSGENKGDDNDAKDFAGRLALQPFGGAENGILSNLHLGISGTVGNQEKDFSDTSFKTIGGTNFVDFVDDTIHTGDRVRLGTEAIWLIGPASIKAEWTHMQLDDFKLASVEEDFDFYAWYVSGSYMLTGEDKGFKRTIPSRPFDVSQNMWGAWEIAARYSAFHSDDDLFDLGMATGTDKAEAFTLGLNWYLNEFLRFTFNYEHTGFDDSVTVAGKSLDDEDAFLVQCQLEF